jgi:two-component system, OmpR family, KDP operon response regulator KdpE
VASVVIIEDDARIRTSLTRALQARGHAVHASGEGVAGLGLVVGEQPDVVVLDLGLPDVDGGTLLAMIRAASDVPVIVATARDDDADIVRTLDGGADDYMLKPFSAEQLDARIRAVLRRAGNAGAPAPALVVGPLRVEPDARRATLDGEELDLTRLEFDLLAYLAARAGKVVAKRDLLRDVWHQPYGGADRTVDVHLSWLRRKLGERASDPRFLHTVRGVGVRLGDPAAG